jgi:hypothetical protein
MRIGDRCYTCARRNGDAAESPAYLLLSHCVFGLEFAPKGPDKSAQGNALGMMPPARDSSWIRAL